MYAGIFSDPDLIRFFEKTDKPAQIRRQKEYLTFLTGGSKTYSGKTMLDSHKGRGITDKEFNLVAGHAKAAMVKLNVPAELQDQVMGALSSLHDDVVVA